MTTQQQLILDEIEDRCRVKITITPEYANTGIIRALDEETLAATRSLKYDFQDDRAAFRPVASPDLPVGVVYYDRPVPSTRDCIKSTPMELITAVIDYLEGR